MITVPERFGDFHDSVLALSVRQPWAWLIVNGVKDIENRTRPFKYRGRLLIHAGLQFDHQDFPLARAIALRCGVKLPGIEEFRRGGILGDVNLIDCVTKSHSLWFAGTGFHGLVLEQARQLPFVAMPGRLGLFPVRLASLPKAYQKWQAPSPVC